jgi:hypothetical protein
MRTPSATTAARFLAAAGLVVAAASAAPAQAAPHHRGALRSLSSPPPRATRHFTLRVKGSTTRVVLFAGRFRRHVRGDVKLGVVRVRRHTVKVNLRPRVPSGPYFIIACPAHRRGGCKASAKPTLVVRRGGATVATAVPTLVEAASASAPIGEAGGSLRASGPGAALTLTVPARSLPDDVLAQCDFQQQFGFWRRICPASSAPAGETITLTPLSALAGVSSLGRFVAGAQLAPGGLAAVRGATLTFAPAHRIPARRLVAVAYSGTGGAAGEVPMTASHGQLRVALGEIGDGVAILERGSRTAQGATRARAAVHTQQAARSEGDGAVYSQLIAGELSILRDTGHDLGDGSFQARDVESAIRSTLEDWHRDILGEEVKPGLADDAAAETAIRDLLQWARDTALIYGTNGDIPPEVLRLLAGVYNRAQQRCASASGFSPGSIRPILAAYRSLVLAGHPDNVTIDALLACEHFTVTFDSTITTTFGGQDHGTHTNEYKAVIPIEPSPSATAIEGQARGAYARATGQMQSDPLGCGATGGGTFVSHDDELSGTGAVAQVPDFTLPSARIGGPAPKLELLLGQPTETYHLYNTSGNPGCVTSTSRSLPAWTGNFLVGHKGEVDGTAAAPNAYVFLLQPSSGQLIASRSYDQTFASGQNTETEHTAITVTHTPGAFTPL